MPYSNYVFIEKIKNKFNSLDINSLYKYVRSNKLETISITVVSTLLSTALIGYFSISKTDLEFKSVEITKTKIGDNSTRYRHNECGNVMVAGEIKMNVYNSGFKSGSLSKAEIDVMQFSNKADVEVEYLDKSSIGPFSSEIINLRWSGLFKTLSEAPKWDATIYGPEGKPIKNFTFSMDSKIPNKLLDCI